MLRVTVRIVTTCVITFSMSSPQRTLIRCGWEPISNWTRSDGSGTSISSICPTSPSLCDFVCSVYIYTFPSSILADFAPTFSHSSRRRKGRRSARGIMTGRRWAFLKASIADAGLSVRIVVPIAMKKLQAKGVSCVVLDADSNSSPECCAGAHHILSQCPHHSIWTWPKPYNVCSACHVPH